MLIALLATLMFFAMLAATFSALRSEMSEQPVKVEVRNRRDSLRRRRSHPW